MVGQVEVPSRNVGRGAGKHRRGSGKAGVRGLMVWSEVGVLEDEVRQELQEESRAGTTRRGRNCWRNRGLENNEAREELQEESRAGNIEAREELLEEPRAEMRSALRSLKVK